MAKDYKRIKKLTYWLLFLVLLVFVLVEAREFLYPLVMAMLFAYLLYPVVKRLEQWGVPRLLANFVTIITSMALFAGLLVLLYKQLSVFLTDFPELKDKALANIDLLQAHIDRKFGDDNQSNERWLRMQVNNALDLSGNAITSILLATTSTVTKFALMPVYIFLMLYYRNKFEVFLFKALPSHRHGKVKVMIDEISSVTKRYMGGVVIVILILCFLNSAGLLIIGVEYAILLGIVSAFINFIPYFGTLIGGAVPLLYTLVVQGDPQKTLAVLLFFLVVQFTENNILTPNITGSRVNINPLFTILSIIVGGMLWGLPGMFVAVPVMGMFKIYFDNSPQLQAFSYLLGTEGTEEHALTIDKILRFLHFRK
ncbi:AI-2E family transporter [Pontibacter ramchanderi]|uniref:Putative PurR-regulated permease PerM n=1 Tax=Pontibacter ramchanderi TaxID=1179743 RepID=A0A2N3V1C5_9BACT|nr:AI-2E family transporter [Pontibacter ramchanderi]PKV75415.1 putative PurR-regulated permease PerM [Pontibacter ramchanderi]